MKNQSKPKPEGGFTSEQAGLILLNKRFAPPEYCFLPQVRNGTGYSKQARTADALAMSVWPSRGLHLHGFEIKVSRSDLMSELRNPAKAEDIGRHCEFWWLVVGWEGILGDLMIPESWGILAGKGETLKQVKPAAANLNVQPMDKLFLASVLRNTMESASPLAHMEAEISNRVRKEVEKKSIEIRAQAEREKGRVVEERGNLHQRVHAFEKASGIHIDRYSDHFNTEIGLAVSTLRHISRNGRHDWNSMMANLVRVCESTISECAALRAGLNALTDSDIRSTLDKSAHKEDACEERE